MTAVSMTWVLSGSHCGVASVMPAAAAASANGCDVDRGTRILHDLDVFANQRADLQVLGLEPIEATRIDRYRHEVDHAEQRHELRH